MADRSKIEWTDSTWNPIRARNRATGKVGWHCEHASPGCVNCYSAGFNARLGTGLPFKPGHRTDVEIFLDSAMLTQPLRWTRPRMIFVCSMTDLFADFVPDAVIDQVFAVMALCPQHTSQVLTKRSARLLPYFTWEKNFFYGRVGAIQDAAYRLMATHGDGRWNEDRAMAGRRAIQEAIVPRRGFRNVWLGVSAEDQRRADERVPDLLAAPAAVRFVSAEPLLGPLNLDPWLRVQRFTRAQDVLMTEASGGDGPGFMSEHQEIRDVEVAARPALDWIIVGGESGRNARPMHPDWVRSIHDQCAAASVPFFFKQWGEYQPDQIGPEDARSLTRPLGHVEFRRVGKKLAGRRLFGVEHNGMPLVAAAPLAGVA